MSDKLVIYHAGVTGEFIGSGYAEPDPMEPGKWLIPARAYREKPPEPDERTVAVWGENGWALVADFRGQVYGIVDGAVVQHHALGELPYGLTVDPRPGLDYVWLNGEWALDKSAHDARSEADARVWRDGGIESVRWLRERHREEVELGVPTTLTAEQYGELLMYVQALRDWPQTEGFPAVEQRPAIPEWVAE
jgi:hypothetical protein